MLREELSVLENALKYSFFQDFFTHYNSEKSLAIESITGIAPQTIGDIVTREQAIGRLGLIHEILSFFADRQDILRQLIAELENPNENTP
jgi:hypothetical protein